MAEIKYNNIERERIFNEYKGLKTDIQMLASIVQNRDIKIEKEWLINQEIHTNKVIMELRQLLSDINKLSESED